MATGARAELTLTLPLVGVRRTGETGGSPRQVGEFVLQSKTNETGWGYDSLHSFKTTPTPTLRVDPPHKGKGKAP